MRRTFYRIRRSLLIVMTLLILVFFSYKQFLQNSPIHTDAMMNECMNFINAEMDRILQLKERDRQNSAFRAIKTNLPLKPIRMSTTTAVFKYTYFNPPVIIKRVIWNPNNGLNEDNMCEQLKGSHRNILNILSKYRVTRRIPGARENEIQTLLWLFFEFLDIKLNDRYVQGDENLIRTILKDALKGLNYLHNQGLVHLDIKIANIMGKTQKNGLVTYKLIDFGYTQNVEPEGTQIPGKNYGTYPFKAPEVVKRNLHGPKSDIWSLGATAWYLSLGTIPFYDDRGRKDMAEYHKFLTPHNTDDSDHHRFIFKTKTSKELKDFIKKCMRVDYTERPSAKELMEHPFIKGIELTYPYSATNEGYEDTESDYETS